MAKTRGFEIAKGFEEQGINLPKRQTKGSAGYDIEAAETVTIPSIWLQGVKWGVSVLKGLKTDSITTVGIKPTLVQTGVKAYMKEDEALYLYNRSSNPLKRFLFMSTGVSVIDADYFGNPDNDGHIMFQFINFGVFPVTIHKGERVGQGIFSQFLKADGDNATGKRIGGTGSTGNKENTEK